MGLAKGEKGKVHSSSLPENVRCSHVAVSWQVGSITEGQMTCVRPEEGSEGIRPPCLGAENHPKLYGMPQCLATQADIRRW